MTMKAHTYYIIFGRPAIEGKLPPFPLAAPLDLLLLNQSINVKFVGRRYTTRPGAPTVVSGKHDHKVDS